MLTVLEVDPALSETTLMPIVDPWTHTGGRGNLSRTPGLPKQRGRKGIKTAKVLTWCIYTPKCFAVIRSSPFMRYK